MNKSEKRLYIRNIIIAALVIVFFSGIILAYYRMLYSEKRNNIIKSGEMTAKESADGIEQYLSPNIDFVKLAAYTLDEMIREGRTDEKIQDYLVGQSTAVRTAVIENSTGLYGYINGRFFSGTNWEPPEGYVATARPWYTRPMEHPGELTILDPYVDVQSGNVMLALGKTLCDGVSVISLDVSLDQIQKLTEEAVTNGDSDIEMILNDTGMVVAHSDRGQIGRDYSSEEGTLGSAIYGRLQQSSDYSFEFVFSGFNYVVYVADLQNGWCCVSVKDATRVFGSLKSILLATIAVVVTIVLIIGAIMTRSNRYVHMSAKAIAASEAKSEFLSNMSHEIRTPINAILGMNEMILRESRDQTILTYAGNVRTAGKNLLDLVNGILDFSKIEAGKIEIIPVDYELSSTINDLVNMVQNRAENKGLLVEVNIDGNIPRTLHGDEMRIRQVIANLLTNAVKYTEKGSVSIQMGFVRMEEDADSIELTVSVKDTGIGIREEDMPRLFTQFERIEENRNRNIEGTGLGLSITKSLLELMGSSLHVESVYGEGSTFGFAVKQGVVNWEPMGDYEAAYRDQFAAREKYRERFIAPNARVLVVDDNPMNLMVFESLVKQTCVVIDTASGGDEGIVLSRNTKYDMVFLDHMMPGKDGIQTLKEIRADEANPNLHTPVICLTANAVAGARDIYLNEGFDDYLTKPIHPDTLEDMMLAYLPADKVEKSLTALEEETGGKTEPLPEGFAALSESGIDAEEGLRNSGTVQAYRALLKIFREDIDEKTEELNRLCRDGDLENYTIKVHALKSSARIIGARDFGELAQELENAGKAGDTAYILSHHEAFIQTYGTFAEPLAAVLSDYAADDGKPEADAEFMTAVFDEIKSAAEDMDCDRLDSIFDEMSEYRIPEENRELFDRIRDALERFEYSTILSLLSQEAGQT